VADDSDRLAPVAIWSDGMRRLRELAGQMTAAAQAMAVAGARATPPALAQPLAGYTNQLLAISAAVTTPLRRLLDEQEQLVEMMAEWAQQHQRFSEQIADWADQQRQLSERMLELARPLLDQSAMLESLQAEWSARSDDHEPLPSNMEATSRKPAAKKSSATKSSAKKSASKKAARSGR
jgi:chromosome segregation ATPase